MHIVVGETVISRHGEETVWEQPALQLQGVEVVLDEHVEGSAQKVLSQHHILVYGNRRKKLIDCAGCSVLKGSRYIKSCQK